MTNNILITGGSGFVGTQVAYELLSAGHNVTIVDRALKHTTVPGATVVEMDYLEFVQSFGCNYDTVIHLAAEHIVEKSVTEPAKYYANNVIKMKGLLDAMVASGTKNIIFSSSGNVYGRQGSAGLLSEDMYYDPENPYASTKVAGELLIKDYAKAYGIKFVNFRYFNAAGADPTGRFGYVQRPATHVIPILCNTILNGSPFSIYGNDYKTKDGTCVRDYVHVADLARAHSLAINFLNDGSGNEAFNIGGGSAGVSVKELVQFAADVVGREPVVISAPRRAGDPAKLVADISKAAYMLKWTPRHDIKQSILHAWNWETKFQRK